MAESRLIRRAILDSEKFNSLSTFVQNFYFRLLLVADDYGLYDARKTLLRCSLYPLSIEKVSESDVVSGLAACEKAGLVRLYSVEGKEYLQIVNYGQRCKTKPKYPMPPDFDGEPPRVTANRGEPRRTAADDGESPLKTQSQSQSQTNTQTNTQTQQQPHAQGPAAPAAAAAGGEFEKWREAMCRAFPTLRGAARLSEKVEEAAREAYGRLPMAAEKAEMLAAYLDDRLPTDRYRNKFYRPVSQIKFFENLEDVLGHAELWRRETGWKADKPKPKPKEEPRAKTPEEEAADELESEQALAEWTAFVASLKDEKPAEADGRMSLTEAKRILHEPRKPMTPAEEAEAAAEREAILRRVAKGGASEA